MQRKIAAAARVRAAIPVVLVAACAGAGSDDAARSNETRAGDLATAEAQHETILFLGTSLTAGYGVGADSAFPAILGRMIESAGLPFRVVNAGMSGETSAGGLRRLEWSLQQPVSVLFLELGANDGLRGLDPDQMRANLDSIIAKTRDRNPDADVIIAGMQAPPNMGPAFTTRFRRVFTDLARAHDAALVPFLLEAVAGDPALNQDDRIHPTAAGHRVIAATVWPVLEPVLRARAGARPAG